MPQNLEIKAHIETSLDEVLDAVRALGASDRGTLHQTDTYFRVPHGRLKLRVLTEGGAELISYVRMQDQNERLSTYTTVPVQDPERLRRILEGALGILTVVRKQRRLFMAGETRLHLDTVEGLGDFLEFEVPVNGRGAQTQARERVEELSAHFRLTPASLIRGSYSDMLLAAGEGGSVSGGRTTDPGSCR